MTLALSHAPTRSALAPNRLQGWIAHDIAFGRFELWLPVLGAIGIALAVAVPFEPQPLWLGVALAALVALWIVLGRSSAATVAPAALAAAAIVAGCLALSVEERLVGTPLLETAQTVNLEGTVAAVDRRGANRQSVTLGDLSGAIRGAQPWRVRIALRGGAFVRVGERIAVTAHLFPLQGPAMPGGYDPARRLYFDGIGATGYSFGAARSLAAAPYWSLSARIDATRALVERRIAAAVPEGQVGFASALLVGLTGMMDERDVEALRVAGLAHILSISGVHMVLVAGSVFGAVRFLLALVPAIALAYPIRKWAAVAGLAAATAYLAVSGGSVATVRSYIMFAVALLAILADRPALTMRTVAVAAVLVMLIDPISVTEPSFQMSFAAVIALVGFFEWWAKRRSGGGRGWPIVGFFLGLALTSLLAGAATAPASAYHFHRLPPLGIVGNLAAMPIMSFVTMPAGVVALLLMPFGLETLPLVVMDRSLSVVMAIAHHVAGWSGTAGATGSIPVTSALLATAGLLWLAIFTAPWRLAGIALLAAAFAVAPFSPRYDVLVAEDGATIAARGSDGRFAVLGKPSGFTTELWLKADGDTRKADKHISGGSCDAMGCTLPLGMGLLAAPRSAHALDDDCALAEVVIALDRTGPCAAALVIDRTKLVFNGAVAARRDGDRWTLAFARPYGMVRRWHTAPAPMIRD